MDTTESEGRRTDLTVPIEERFTLESRLAYSLSGQLFKAIDRSSRGSVALWISRLPLPSAGVDRFLRRAEQLFALPGQPEALAFGLDPMRHGWVAFRIFSGRHILEGRVDRREAERRWLGCVRAVERMHKMGLACGDVCLESFLLTSGGEVKFFGGLGVLFSGSELFTAAPASEAQELHMYLAPEQADSCSCSMSTDVFALSRLAYRLFSGRPLAQVAKEISGKLHPSFPELERAPAWLNTTLVPLFACSPEDRPKDATSLMQALLRERNEILTDGAGASTRAVPALEAEITPMEFRQQERKSRTPFVLLAAAILGVAAGFSLLRPGGLSALLSRQVSAHPINLEEVQSLGSSDDPMSHEALLRILASTTDASARNQVTETILARARRLGFIRSSALVRGWVLKGSSVALTNGEAPVALKALNPSMTDEARVEVLRKAYQADQADKGSVAQLAAAIGLDQRKIELFRPIFVLSAEDFGRLTEIAQQSTPAIMAVAPPIRSLYFADILESSQMSAADTIWLLARLREQGEPNVRPLVAHGVANGAFNGPTRVFADALTGAEPLSTRDRIVFVACLTSGPSKAGAAALATSYHPNTPRALLALVWLSDEPEVRTAALDGLFAKPLADPALQRIADFIKSKRPEERDRYSRVFAAAGLSDLLTDKEFSDGFALLQQGAPEPELLAALLQRAPSRVVFEVIGASGSSLQANVYLDLLKHPSKDVRLEALKRLHSFNDATMYALLRQMYDDERDEDVRQEYRAFLGS